MQWIIILRNIFDKITGTTENEMALKTENIQLENVINIDNNIFTILYEDGWQIRPGSNQKQDCG